MRRMRGLRLLGSSQVEVVELPQPQPGESEVLIRVTTSALCGSELKAYRAPQAQVSNQGHEAIGVVVEADKARTFKPGERVGIHAVWGCGRCRWCAAGRYTFCDQRRQSPAMHVEWLSAPEHVLLPIDNDISDGAGVLLSGDGLGVPYHVSTRLNTRGGDVVCVIGAGPIGLGNTLVQSFLGAEVIVVDTNSYRLELAQALGARHVIDPNRVDPVEAAVELTRGNLANKCIECVGLPQTFQLALRLVGKAGTVMCVGEQPEVTLNVSRDLIRRDITLMGSWYYHYCEYPFMVDLYRRGLEVEKLITHRYPVSDGARAFQEFASGRTGKVLLDMNGPAISSR